MDNNKIGKFIAILRQEKGLTQKQLGEKLYVTDKAVSKWERGYSLPDISLLNHMAEILGVGVVDILSGEKNSNNNIDIEKEINAIKKDIFQKNRKRIKKMMYVIIILALLLIYICFRNVKLGYNLQSVYYSHSNRNINIGIVKTSFMIENNDRSFAYKNLRNSNIVENEIKNYLKTLKYSTCNDTVYYYDEKDDFSIIEYSVSNHIFYSTISYEIVDYDYCEKGILEKYSNMLGGLGRIHSLKGGKMPKDANWNKFIEVTFIDVVDYSSIPYKLEAKMEVLYFEKNSEGKYIVQVLEDSEGFYEIKNNKLYYYRTKILEKSKNLDIPEVSSFEIKNKKLLLNDNYLSAYEEKIELK